MSDQDKAKQRLEIAHVLFLDIVGYSKLLTDEQSEALQELNQIVRKTEAAREAEAAGQLTILPTGDGMALVFTGSVEEPVECALEISHALRAQPSLPVRMGVHSGPVHHVKDANQRENIAGIGINIAQRVMDCGDAGHILISKRVADDLAQHRRWQPYLHELGDVEVKHGTVVSLVNLYAETIGNPESPSGIGKSRGRPRILSKSREKGLSPLVRAIFIIVGIVLGLSLVLAIVSVIFAPAMLRSLGKGQAIAPPQPPAIPSPPSLADTIKSEVAKKVTDSLQRAFDEKKRAGAESSVAAARQAEAAATIPDKSIAVLPFENLSDDKSNAYFTEGIQDQILTKLAGIADLKVISRTSTAKYKSKPEDLPSISRQLGVANVLEGTVQRAADKVRVNVQLIDARADSHVWAKSYDREIKDVFAVESEISQEIADALQTKLSPNEANALASAPTKDSEAYDLFLRGEYEERENEISLTAESFDRAASFYQQALDRDPNFALAAARLAENRCLRHWFVSRLADNDAAVRDIENLANHALTLAPNLAEAHVALGSFYYYVNVRFEDALREFGRALELQPNNTRALELSAYVHRRQGKMKLSLEELAKCEERDPRDATLVANIAQSYATLRMWPEAKRASLRALALGPRSVIGMRVLLLSCINGDGDLSAAKKAIVPGMRISTSTFISLDTSAIEPYLHVLDRDFAGALKICETEVADPDENRGRLIALVVIHLLSNDVASATDEIDKARGLLETRVHERPNDPFALIQLAWVNLALKNNAEALRLATRAGQSPPTRRDNVLAALINTGVAQIQARAGDSAAAVKTLQGLLAMPAGFSVSIPQLKIDPVWDPIRNEPAFQKLLVGKEAVGLGE